MCAEFETCVNVCLSTVVIRMQVGKIWGLSFICMYFIPHAVGPGRMSFNRVKNLSEAEQLKVLSVRAFALVSLYLAAALDKNYIDY